MERECLVRWVNGEKDEVERLTYCLPALLLLPHCPLHLTFLSSSLEEVSPVPELWEPHQVGDRGPSNIRDRQEECLGAHILI